MRPPEDFNLNLVRTFVAIYESRSVTRAAERLNLSQPTVSHALAMLRAAYSDRLFDRSAAGMVPTVTADRLFERLSQALSGIEATLEQRQEFDPGTSTRRFRLAMSDIGVLYFAPPLFRHFQEFAPRIETDILEISDSVLEDLAMGRLDLAVGNLPTLSSSTRSTLLFREHYVCLLSTDHPSIGARMNLKAFASARHIMVSSPFSGHQLIDQVLGRLGVTRNVVARVPQFTVLPQLLAQSDLLVILPSRVAALYVAQGRLRSLDLPVAIPEFDVRVHWHARHEASYVHQWLAEETARVLGKL